jgi:hypothetical protein
MHHLGHALAVRTHGITAVQGVNWPVGALHKLAGPATKLLAVDGDGDDWWLAPARRWNFAGGWQPDPNAQLDIRCLGDYFLIDESKVIEVQHEMLVTFERFHAK